MCINVMVGYRRVCVSGKCIWEFRTLYVQCMLHDQSTHNTLRCLSIFYIPSVWVLALPPVSSAVEGIWPENVPPWWVSCPRENRNLKETMCFFHMGVSINGGSPIAGCFIMENPIVRSGWWLGVPPWLWNPPCLAVSCKTLSQSNERILQWSSMVFMRWS